MGNCKHCGKPAGFLRGKHAECEEQYQQRERVAKQGSNQITSEVIHAINSTASFNLLEEKIAEIEKKFLVPQEKRRNLLITGWESAVDQFLDDGILNVEEETRLVTFMEHFALSQFDLDEKGAFTKIAKAAVLRDVMNGIIPQRMSVNGSLPINFQKGEQIVWAFPDAKYLEDKSRRQFVGGSSGVSVRVLKGVYYRVGAFKGHVVENTERVHVDTGWVVITSKNIYFAGSQKSLRIPYNKIVSFEPFSDGLGVMRDTTTAKPQIFVTGDGWFSYNLVTNLSQM